MNSIVKIAPLLLSLAACQSNPTASITVATPAQAKPEMIHASMLTINGQPQKELTTQALERQLGRPDSVVRGVVECGSELADPGSAPGDYWYYGKTAYEVNGTQAILAHFDVTSGKFQGKLGELMLNQNTTLEDVRRFYPVSAKEADTPSTFHKGELMSLPFEMNGVQIEIQLHLIFKKGRLQEVDFWSEC